MSYIFAEYVLVYFCVNQKKKLEDNTNWGKKSVELDFYVD